MPYSALLKFLVYSLAIWRLTYLIARDNGPFHVFDWLRYKIGIRTYLLEDGSKSWKEYENQIAEMVDCMKCLSLWITLLFVPSLLTTNSAAIFIYDLVATVLALWGVATLIVMMFDGMEE